MASQRAPRYADPVYQKAHDDTYSTPVVKGVPAVLPPGVTQGEFDKALDQLAAALGEDAVYRGDRLAEYVDPYEIPERGPRHIPGAAVW